MSLTADGAGALMLSVGTRNYTATWRAVRFVVEELVTTCNLTLEGSFHSSTLKKIERAPVGQISRASLGTCSGFITSLLTETLPWQVEYGSFEGTLPAIERVRLRLIGFSIRMTIGVNCLARSESNRPAVVRANREAGGTITSLTGEGASAISFSNCAIFNVGLEGTTSSFTRATLTLIGEPPSLSPSPVVEFGRVEPEGVVARSVTIRAGTEALEVRRISLARGASFAILDPNRCIGSRLAERGSCVFKAIFAAPREAGRAFEDTVTVETSIGALEDTLRAST
jgi:hypothetical protein